MVISFHPSTAFLAIVAVILWATPSSWMVRAVVTGCLVIAAMVDVRASRRAR